MEDNKQHIFTFADYYPTARLKGAIQVIAALSNIQLTLNPIPPAQTRRPDVLKLCGVLGLLPGLRLPNGSCLSGYGTIARYFAKLSNAAGLYGLCVAESGEVDQWIDVSFNELFHMMFGYLGPILGGIPISKEVHEKATKDLRNWCKIVSNHLELRTYLVGRNITAADICVASIFSIIFSLGIDEKFSKNYTNLTRWLKHITSLPEWHKVFGVFKIQKVQLPATHFAEIEEKKQQKKQEKKKAAAPKPALPAMKEKSIFHDLENLPKSPFNLTAQKEFIFKHPDRITALKEIYAKFDAKGYSVWKLEYDKAEGEGEVLYQTNNLLTGFIQRFPDGYRRFAMGVHAILGEEPKLELRGVWLLRGTEFPHAWKEHPTTEYYSTKPLDLTKEADQKLFEAYFTGKKDAEVDGLRVREIKFYK